MVGEGQGGHARIDGSLDQPGGGGQGLEEGVGGVGVEVDEHGATVSEDIIRRQGAGVMCQVSCVKCQGAGGRWQGGGW